MGIIPISQIRKLSPKVTQLMAELIFALDLVALKLMFLLNPLAPPFIWCQLWVGSCVRPSASIFHNSSDSPEH